MAHEAQAPPNPDKPAPSRKSYRTRLNAVTHGFTAALNPPTDPAERKRYDRLFYELYEEYMPCGRAEWLVLEELVILELRRMKIQEALMGDIDVTNEEQLKRLTLLSRYETDTENKLEKKWKRLEELQGSRAERRGLALEAALVQSELAKMKQQMGDEATEMAQRCLGREMRDLAGMEPETAHHAALAFIGSDTAPDADAPSFWEVDDGAPGAPDSFGDGEQEYAAPSPADRLPGPPWDPWRGASRDELEQWNDELIERKKARLREELAALEEATEPPRELDAVAPEDPSSSSPAAAAVTPSSAEGATQE